MKAAKELVGKCPNCGHSNALSQFLIRSDNKYKGGFVLASTHVRCPSCNASLRFKYMWAYLTFLIFVLGALAFVMVFIPMYVPHFSYMIGIIFLIIYLLQRFRILKTDQIFVNKKQQ